jgi:hypothetical protein
LIIVGLLIVGTVGSVAEDAKVRINVKPNQAYIFVDGTPFGDSSRTFSVAPGKHTIGIPAGLASHWCCPPEFSVTGVVLLPVHSSASPRKA